MKTTAEKIEIFEQNVKELELLVRTEKEKLRNAKLDNVFELHGIKIGSIVKDKDGEYEVTVINVRTLPFFYLKGNKKNKDGTFGKAERNLLREWELVKS